MKKFIVEKFKKGNWLNRSNSLLSDSKKVSSVLMHSAKYMKKGGLKEVQKEITLLRDYVTDVIKGRYKEYDKSALTLSLAALIYVVSPLDLVPDFVPLGLFDDVSIVLWALSQLGIEIEKYKTTLESNSEPEKDNLPETTQPL